VRVAHFDCFSGASGDMILGALIDAGVDVEAIRAGLDSLGLPIKLTIERVKRGGIAAVHARVEAPHEHVHRHLHHVEAIIDKGRLTDRQKELAKGFFHRLAEAEATVHGIPIEKVHFHEVGALDSIADFVGAAIGLDLLGAERITSRSVPPGSGTIQCEHGLMPVPAPATALLLRGVPLASSTIDTELTTPTGAAILTSVVAEWTDSPALTVERIGHGAGTKDFPTQPNVLRLLVGTAANPDAADTVWMMETNLDDVPGEIIGYTTERLFEAGALDVWTSPIQMKKNRPGVLLGVLAPMEKVSALEAILFRETGTFGVRRYAVQRSKLQRETIVVDSPWGPVKAKRGRRDGHSIITPEYDDCARLAREHDIPLREIYQQITTKHTKYTK
jgi:uncharacterized protein (TIGR00299 family) protein